MKNKYLIPLALSNTTIEWAEYMIYLYLSATISQLFFPQLSASLGLLLTFAIFGVSHLSMPIGAILLGRLSDKVGRKPPMIIAIFLMGLATLGIGFLPTYSQIGILAPLLLLFFRMIQGISAGGEFNSALIFLMEHTKDKKPLAGYAADSAALAGGIIGGFIAVWVNSVEYEHAWRVPYIVAGILSLILCLLRSKLTETPVFLDKQKKNKLSNNPLKEALQNKYRGALYKIACIGAFVFISTYICIAYYANFLYQHTSLSLDVSQKITLYLNLSSGLLAFLVAYLIKVEHNIKSILSLGIALMSISAILMYQVPLINHMFSLYIILIIYIIGKAFMLGSFAYYMYTLLPTEIRCSGTSFSWTIAVALGGGTATMIAATLVEWGYIAWPGIYVAAIGLCAVILILKNDKVTVSASIPLGIR